MLFLFYFVSMSDHKERIMRLFALFIMLVSFPLCAQNISVKVGDQEVIIEQIQKGQGGKNFVHVHESETTALEAARAVVNKRGGFLLTLHHGGGRNIVFHLQGQRYEFDPNRIFTDEGIKKTLTQYSHYQPDAHREVKKLADKILSLLPQDKIIAVHNNQSYSIRNYLPGRDMASEIAAINLDPKQYFRNFYFVTRMEDFLRIKEQGFNGVLQAARATDDGSLSVRLSKQTYINVEAGYAQLAQQIKMLELA